MPAIQLDRLNHQLSAVVECFDDPQALVKASHDLFEFYADRTRRPGQAGEPPPLLPAYNVLPPVIRRLLRSLTPYVQQNPRAGLNLVDALWAEDYLEHRLLAIQLLGEIPPVPVDAVLQRVRAWASPRQEARLLAALFSSGVARLQNEALEDYLQLLQEWLRDTRPAVQTVGLLALPPLIEKPRFENLPFVYQSIAVMAQGAPADLRPYLLAVVRALARRSSQETAHFLTQALVGARDNTPSWLIRRSLDLFPGNLQAALREAMNLSGSSS